MPRRRVGAVLAAALLAASCNEPAARDDAAPSRPGGSATMAGGTVEFVGIGSGNLAWNPRESDFGPQFVLFRSKAAWERLAGHYQFGDTAADWRARLSRVDFAHESIAALTLGEMGSTGYTIRLVRIESGAREFVLASTRPEGMAGAMMTHPFQLVILKTAAVPADARFVLDGKDTPFERHVME